MSVSGKRVAGFLLGVISVSILISAVVPMGNASAAQITARSLTLQAGATDGGSLPSGVVNHYFQFTLPSTTTLGSIQFVYCTTAGGTCSMPAGLDTQTGVTVDTTGSGIGGWTLDTTTNGSPFIKLAATTVPGSATNMKVKLLGVKNPTAANTSFYVRISSFATLTATGGSTDTGTVAASTANAIQLTGTMPESLIFCTGATIAIPGSNIPDCSTATSGSVSFNQLFSTTATAWATSQMAASTNATSGYAITVTGPTLTFGSNTIPAVGGTATASAIGTGQFGMNLVTDTTPTPTYFDAHNGDVYPTSDGVFLNANPATAYATTNLYAFVAGTVTTVANSDNGSPGTSKPTDTQRYTATYIVNVAGHQAAGQYQTTLTYICTPTF